MATEKSDRLQRCLAWVQDCKRAVNELRSEVKAAISNREKCCMVLSAAMAASLALESVLHLSQLHLACQVAKCTSAFDTCPLCTQSDLFAFMLHSSVGPPGQPLRGNAVYTFEQWEDYVGCSWCILAKWTGQKSSSCSGCVPKSRLLWTWQVLVSR